MTPCALTRHNLVREDELGLWIQPPYLGACRFLKEKGVAKSSLNAEEIDAQIGQELLRQMALESVAPPRRVLYTVRP